VKLDGCYCNPADFDTGLQIYSIVMCNFHPWKCIDSSNLETWWHQFLWSC
jgi:hypothetical protein